MGTSVRVWYCWYMGTVMVFAQSGTNFGETKLATHWLRFVRGTPTRNTVNRKILRVVRFLVYYIYVFVQYQNVLFKSCNFINYYFMRNFVLGNFFISLVNFYIISTCHGEIL